MDKLLLSLTSGIQAHWAIKGREGAPLSMTKSHPPTYYASFNPKNTHYGSEVQLKSSHADAATKTGTHASRLMEKIHDHFVKPVDTSK